MGLLDKLSVLGLKNFSGKDLFEKEKTSTEDNQKQVEKKQEPVESDYLYMRKYECPVCATNFEAPSVRSGMLRMVGQDKDLRPRYRTVDIMKYDVVHCNTCGYAVLSKYYGQLAGGHKKLIEESITKNYKPMVERPWMGCLVSYDDAILKYRLALANAIARKAKNSEKGYICLRMAWLIRGKKEELETKVKAWEQEDLAEGSNSENGNGETQIEKNSRVQKTRDSIRSKLEDCVQEEEELLENALEGLMLARTAETPPIAGMKETTLDYLLAVLCERFDRKEEAVKLLQGIITSKTVAEPQKEKARELMQEIRQR